MKYYFRPSAVNDLKQLPKVAQKRVFDKLDFYFKSAKPLKFAKSLTDKTLGDFRFRIGDYRVIFDVKNNKAIILKIGHRKEVYK